MHKLIGSHETNLHPQRSPRIAETKNIMSDQKTRKCFGHQKKPALIIQGFEACSATHPKTPNYSGHSRGRKTHLAKNETHTICNMLIDEYVPFDDASWTIIRNGKCGNCFNESQMKKARIGRS